MPLGGLKWEDELEPKEFKQVKKEVQVLGIDDAPFERKDKEVKVVAVLARGAKMMDGVFHTQVKRDGLDATGKIAQLVRDIERENARAIILNGVTFAGFNTVDIKRLYKETGIPVIVSMQKRPDFHSIRSALKNLDKGKERWDMMRAAGKVREVELDGGRKVYVQCEGIKTKDAEEIIKLTTVNGLVPEPVRAAHMVAKGAYTDIRKKKLEEDAPHVKAYRYVKDKHKEVTRWKRKTFPGVAGEVVSFLFALLVAWLFIQGLGWALGTPSPLVVVESESMVHGGSWEQWYFDNNLNPDALGGALNVGDIILVKGDDPKDMEVGDVIVYTKYGRSAIGGEPIIHRIVGIAEIDGSEVSTEGAVIYEGGELITPCDGENGWSSRYTLKEIRDLYRTEPIERLYPDIGLDEFRVFITKGDANRIEDQCLATDLISYPVHECLLHGRAKFDIPYLGYVKLGLVCVYRGLTGNVCPCTCWWAADHPKCCK